VPLQASSGEYPRAYPPYHPLEEPVPNETSIPDERMGEPVSPSWVGRPPVGRDARLRARGSRGAVPSPCLGGSLKGLSKKEARAGPGGFSSPGESLFRGRFLFFFGGLAEVAPRFAEGIGKVLPGARTPF